MWAGRFGGKPTAWTSAAVPPKTEGEVRLLLHVPVDAKPGRYVVPVDLRYDRWDLPQFTEAIVLL